jgi:hypothetical protein
MGCGQRNTESGTAMLKTLKSPVDVAMFRPKYLCLSVFICGSSALVFDLGVTS